jgi:N-acylneuraminate cytidylyltransferase
MPLRGIPLYLHAVRQGLRVAGRVVVTTDVREILDGPPEPGCALLERSADLANDDTSMSQVLEDVIARLDLRSETVLLLQATSPLRTDLDVRTALARHASGEHDLVMSVTQKDRGILKYGTISAGIFQPVSRPEYCFSNRQSLPQVYAPNGAIYAFEAEAFLRTGGIPCQRIGAVEMPAERSIDIDTLEEFLQVEKAFAMRTDYP